MTERRGRGRPPVDPSPGQSPTVNVRLSAEMIRQLDLLAEHWKVTRSEAIRELLRVALGLPRDRA